MAGFLLAFLILLAGCGSEDTGSSVPTNEQTGFPEGTISSAQETTGGETAAAQPPAQDGSGTGNERGGDPGARNSGGEDPDVVLRVEGSPGSKFSGICNVGGEESVISGQAPQRFSYELNGQRISCRVQKQGSPQSTLRVILIAGNTTRSVQQTSGANGVVNVSFGG